MPCAVHLLDEDSPINGILEDLGQLLIALHIRQLCYSGLQVLMPLRLHATHGLVEDLEQVEAPVTILIVLDVLTVQTGVRLLLLHARRLRGDRGRGQDG